MHAPCAQTIEIFTNAPRFRYTLRLRGPTSAQCADQPQIRCGRPDRSGRRYAPPPRTTSGTDAHLEPLNWKIQRRPPRSDLRHEERREQSTRERADGSAKRASAAKGGATPRPVWAALRAAPADHTRGKCAPGSPQAVGAAETTQIRPEGKKK